MTAAALVASAMAAALGIAQLNAQESSNRFQGELVGAGTVSGPRGDAFPALSPDGIKMYFSRVKGRGWGDQQIVVSRSIGGHWSEPQVAGFSGGNFSDRAPRPSPDGRYLYFSSNRTLPDRVYNPNDFNIWYVERSRDGGWGDPVPLPASVNGSAPDIHPIAATDGSIYFASSREGGTGRSDIYVTRRTASGFSDPESLGAPINSERSETDLFVDPEGRFMVLVITEREDGMGGDDLYLSRRTSSGWTRPENLGPAVNTAEYEYGPFVSGGYLYFTSHRSGGGDIYRISLEQVGIEGR